MSTGRTSAGWFRSLLRRPTTRTTGRPRSSNGASSLHLFWTGVDDAAAGFREVAATLEIVRPPVVPELYFWALQASFAGPQGDAGAGHTGLQWHPGHPGSTAVNWGGYGASGGELDGTTSTLPSAMHNVNTRDFAWRAHTPYRIRIHRAPDDVAAPAGFAAWQASVTDLTNDRHVAVRELFAAGTLLRSPMVWSEVFAPCDAPPVVVRWSEFVATTPDGVDVRPRGVVTNYQTFADGGCDNSANMADPDMPGAFVQVCGIGTERHVASGTELAC